MRKTLASIVLAVSLLSSPVAALDDTPAPLTPEALQHLLECKGAMSELLSYAGMLFGAHRPAWLAAVSDNGHSGMMGLWTYQLARPIEVFGHKIDRLSFMNNWIVTEMPRADVLPIIRRERMERAPITATEQYFHFVDEEKGPMLGAFAPTDNMLDKVLGVPIDPDAESRTLFVGCNYSAISRTGFLDAAKRADAIMHKSNADLRRMIEGQP